MTTDEQLKAMAQAILDLHARMARLEQYVKSTLVDQPMTWTMEPYWGEMDTSGMVLRRGAAQAGASEDD